MLSANSLECRSRPSILRVCFIPSQVSSNPRDPCSTLVPVPEVFVGGLLGGMIVFVFSGMAIQAVGTAAQVVVLEVQEEQEIIVISLVVQILMMVQMEQMEQVLRQLQLLVQ